MKKYLLLIALAWGGISFVQAQKIITKNLDADGQKVTMKFDFADTILIEVWNKNSVELEVIVNIDDNQYNNYYSLDTNQDEDQMKMIEHIDFESIKKLKDTDKLCDFNMEINYKLKVPANLEFSLKTISGKVELVGSTGKMSVNSISGFIDYSVPVTHKALIDLATVTGNVYSNVDFDGKPSNEISWVGTKQKLCLNSGNIPVKLKTVSGDIYLRKME